MKPYINGARSVRSATALLQIAAVLSLAIPVSLPAAQLPTAHVKVGDLDLSTPQGQRILQRRIAVAIDQVCVAPNAGMPLSRQAVRGINDCKAKANASAQQQLARLAALTDTRTAQRN